MEVKIYKPLAFFCIIIIVSLLIYYFYLYYWFFDLDNFFILYFASDGTGSVPFVAGGEIGKFSQYQLNIYLFLLGLLLDNFNDKKFIFDLCSLVIFWTFVFALVKTFEDFSIIIR